MSSVVSLLSLRIVHNHWSVRVVLECVNADSSIRKALGIAKEYFKTNGGIEAAGVVVEQGKSATGRVLGAGFVKIATGEELRSRR